MRHSHILLVLWKLTYPFLVVVHLLCVWLVFISPSLYPGTASEFKIATTKWANMSLWAFLPKSREGVWCLYSLMVGKLPGKIAQSRQGWKLRLFCKLWGSHWVWLNIIYIWSRTAMVICNGVDVVDVAFVCLWY